MSGPYFLHLFSVCAFIIYSVYRNVNTFLEDYIEYQGQQHFEPVEFFGGDGAFQDVQRRDKIKAELSRANGVKLVYINYWEDITPALIIERVGIEP